MDKQLLSVPIIGILRGVEQDFFRKIVEASFQVGLRALEVTCNTPNATKMVEECLDLLEDGQLLGMGTICNLEDAKMAIDAGAMFLVTPSFSEEVIEFANSRRVPVVTGALTPTEIYSAWSSGAAMIKVFPCHAMGGATYIRDLRGPFDDIPLVAVGGVTHANLQDYFGAGVQAVGVSTGLFGKEALQKKDIIALTENIRSFTSSVDTILKQQRPPP